MKNKIVISETFPVTVELLFHGWLDSDVHSEFTDSDAEIDPVVGGSFSVWDGYITGKTLEIIPNKKIVQSWRTTEFSDSDKDSILTIEFESIHNEETRLTLTHTQIPSSDEAKYHQGWIDFYITPMKEYFLGL